MATMSDEQILSMSDEDLMNMVEPPAVTTSPAVEQEVVQEPEVTTTTEPTEVAVTEPAVEPTQTNEPEVTSHAQTGIDINPEKTTAPVVTEPVKEDKTTSPATKVEPEKPAPINFEAEYNRIMAPFKANGKEVKLDKADDVIRLMQMGANYTKKMQALQPNLRLLKMLENQGLLDEGKINNLIDLYKGNPAAIQQLVKNSGIDPLEIDTSKDPGYVPGNHSVSEQELQFSSILDEVTSTQDGSDLVVMIDKQWDDASKQALYKEPEILSHLLNQKQSGIFDQIVEEVSRQRMLGNLVNVPFVQAYNIVGQNMQAANRLVMPQPTTAVAPAPTTTVVETRAAAPVTPVANSDKARAASPTKTAPQSVKQVINPLEMSDEDFLNMANIKL